MTNANLNCILFLYISLQWSLALKITLKEMSFTALFTALTAIGAYISIPVGPISITLQTFFVLLSGILLGSRLGAASQILYVLLGLMGLPIFSGFSGGLQTVIKPSFGFLIGFILAAYSSGKIIYKQTYDLQIYQISFKKIFIACFISTIILYIIGIPYMYFILNVILSMNLTVSAVFKMGCLLFLPGDILKIIAISFIGVKLLPKLKNFIY